jgi:hypothetical protein
MDTALHRHWNDVFHSSWMLRSKPPAQETNLGSNLALVALAHGYA